MSLVQARSTSCRDPSMQAPKKKDKGSKPESLRPSGACTCLVEERISFPARLLSLAHKCFVPVVESLGSHGPPPESHPCPFLGVDYRSALIGQKPLMSNPCGDQRTHSTQWTVLFPAEFINPILLRTFSGRILPGANFIIPMTAPNRLICHRSLCTYNQISSIIHYLPQSQAHCVCSGPIEAPSTGKTFLGLVS